MPAFVFAVSPYILEYARMLSSELLASFLLLAIACVGVAFGTTRIALGGLAVGVLAFTKIEFLLLPVVLLVAVTLARPGRRTVARAALATGVIYALLGVYAIGNAIVNDYAGVSVIAPINRLGKVMQYRMQSDAPAEYAETTRAIDAYLSDEAAQLSRGTDPSPYALAARHPEISDNDWRLAGEYAFATIVNAPAEFSWKTLQLLFEDAWVVLLAAGWLLLWAIRGARLTPIGLTSLLLLYDLVLTAVGGYTDFGRLHVASYSLRVLVLIPRRWRRVCLLRSCPGDRHVT